MTDNCNGSIVRLSSKNWIWIIVTVAGAVAANAAVMYGMALSQSQRMGDISDHWRDRTDGMAETLRAEIRRVDDSHPPRELDARIKDLQLRLRALEMGNNGA